MKLIDTHCHLYLGEFDSDRELLIQKAKDSGIEMLLLPNVDGSTVDRMYALCDDYPEFAFPMMGLHPTSVDKQYVKELSLIESNLSNRPYCAIGEIGIDLYWDKTYVKEQKKVFEEQLNWSIALDLPVVIHTRDAFPEVLDSIYKVGPDKLRGVFHSFSGTDAELVEVSKLPQFKLGINGVVTFKNAKLASVIQQTNIERLVLETDAPYLAPVPYRGKRNEPVYIWETAKKVAEVYKMTLEEVVEITRNSTIKLFRNINIA